MKHSYTLIDILIAFCRNKYSQPEVNHLIELAHSYSLTYLRYRYKNLSKVLLAEDVTLQELAIDAIAPLFERDYAGVFIKIKKAFDEWEPKIETEEKALFFLNRIVSSAASNYWAAFCS